MSHTTANRENLSHLPRGNKYHLLRSLLNNNNKVGLVGAQYMIVGCVSKDES